MKIHKHIFQLHHARRPSSLTPVLRGTWFFRVLPFSPDLIEQRRICEQLSQSGERSMGIYYVRNKLLLTQMPLVNQDWKSRGETKDVSTRWKIIKSTAKQRQMFHHWLADLEDSREEQHRKKKSTESSDVDGATGRVNDKLIATAAAYKVGKKETRVCERHKNKFRDNPFRFWGCFKGEKLFSRRKRWKFTFFPPFALWLVFFSSQSRDVDAIAVAAGVVVCARVWMCGREKFSSIVCRFPFSAFNILHNKLNSFFICAQFSNDITWTLRRVAERAAAKRKI